ncbi:MAG: hypothetical protein KAI24_01360 [Planctomycetes bacterium]|nr:hypothetical protein [Planctomycetota bacterium]
MKHTVRSTLLCLGAGVVVQRVLQLVSFLIVGHTLGVAGLGVYAEGMAVAAVLAVVAGAGVRNLIARAVSREPGAARALVAHAVHLRLLVGVTLALVAAMLAFAGSSRPWFWLLCVLHVVPAAFDLKNLVDAAGRTRGEVGLDALAAVAQLALVGWWATGTAPRLEVLAGISLGCRGVYAAGAILAIRRLPFTREPSHKPLGLNPVGAGQTAHELLSIGDVALVALAAGDAAAGYYAVAVRFAAAAMLPSSQLARLLLPHLLHANRQGDARRTFATALRATLWLTAPVCAGGLVVAEGLCALSGAEFTTSGAVLRLLLFAGVCQQLGWQCSHALLAGSRDRAYANGLLWPAVLHTLALGSLWLLPELGGAALATVAATAAALAQAGYLCCGLWANHVGRAFARALPGPVVAAFATAGAAALPVDGLAPAWQLPARLLLGAGAFALALWLLELRGRLRNVGDGLASASGFAR